MRPFAVRKRRAQPPVHLYLEELEGRALLSSVQSLPLWQTTSSTNWSGYAAETSLSSPASNAVTQVSGSWTVPKVTGTTTGYSSVWVGIDGYSSSSVEQLGTEQDTSRTGATSYYAWWEMYPNPSVQIMTMTISPGDSISASVTYSSGAYTLQIKDNTTGQSFSTTQTATEPRSSAEWVVEAPSSFSGVLPLANFGTVNFSQAKATINGTTGPIDAAAWQNTAINMVTSSGSPLDQTSGLTDTTTPPITSSFSVTYTGSSGGGGGGGHHHHGPMETLALADPTPSSASASAATDAKPGPTSEPPAAAAAPVWVVPLAPAGTFVPQTDDHIPASGLKA